MEIFVKIWSAQISLAAQNIWVAQNLRGRGEGGVAAPQPGCTCFIEKRDMDIRVKLFSRVWSRVAWDFLII